jgi:hypothetical protein
MDTSSTSLSAAKEHAQWVYQQQRQRFFGNHPGRNARYHLTTQMMRVVEHNPSTGFFQYDNLGVIHFPEIEHAFEMTQSAQELDNIENEVLVMIWKAIDRLVTDNAFQHLSILSPFRVGFQLSEDEYGLYILRLINW